MKKILILLVIVILVTGCVNKSNKPKVIKKEEKEEVVEEKDSYKDLNNTPIGIYQLNGNTLTKIHEYKTNFVPEKDMNIFLN